MRAAFADWLHRRRWWLFGGWLVLAVLVHALILGMPSWDGFTYHVPPAVEVVQHHALGLDKFWEFPFSAFVPFAELAQIPLLAVLGLPGLLITGPLILFPLCVVAIYKLGRKLTGSPHAGMFAALAYIAIPMINTQPFAGYIDFLVGAELAFFVYAVLELRDAERTWRAAIRVAIAIALVSLTKSTGLYLCATLSALLFAGLFVERDGRRLRVVGKRALGITIAAMAIGAIPEVTIQVIKIVRYGTPIYPYQFNLLGLKLGGGTPTAEMFRQCGLADETWREFGRNFLAAWIWPQSRPHDFFDSRNLGGGLVMLVGLAVLPVFLRTATRFEKWLVASCVIVSVVARDFWYPRFSYSLVVALCVVIGRALLELEHAPRGRWRFWVAGGVLVLHLARPAYDIWQIHQPGPTGFRLDVTGSPWFPAVEGGLQPLPDVSARLIIVEYTIDGFVLPLYGRRLTNEVLYTYPRAQLGPRCSALRFVVARDPTAMFVDDFDYTKDCERTCALRDRWNWCKAWQLFPPPER